jgi:hypothetical protein
MKCLSSQAILGCFLYSVVFLGCTHTTKGGSHMVPAAVTEREVRNEDAAPALSLANKQLTLEESVFIDDLNRGRLILIGDWQMGFFYSLEEPTTKSVRPLTSREMELLIGTSTDANSNMKELAEAKKSEESVVSVSKTGGLGGSLTSWEIESIVRKNLKKVETCNSGKLNFIDLKKYRYTSKFIIGSDGLVSSASVQAPVDQRSAVQSVGTCIKRVVLRYEFPKPRAGREITVTYPFVFSAN